MLLGGNDNVLSGKKHIVKDFVDDYMHYTRK